MSNDICFIENMVVYLFYDGNSLEARLYVRDLIVCRILKVVKQCIMCARAEGVDETRAKQ